MVKKCDDRDRCGGARAGPAKIAKRTKGENLSNHLHEVSGARMGWKSFDGGWLRESGWPMLAIAQHLFAQGIWAAHHSDLETAQRLLAAGADAQAALDALINWAYSQPTAPAPAKARPRASSPRHP